jgi:hypothetical protein
MMLLNGANIDDRTSNNANACKIAMHVKPLFDLLVEDLTESYGCGILLVGGERADKRTSKNRIAGRRSPSRRL